MISQYHRILKQTPTEMFSSCQGSYTGIAEEKVKFRKIERSIARLMVNQTVPPVGMACSSVSAVLSRYYKLTMHRGSTASYYVAFRYVSQYKYPRGDASDKSDFSYDLPLCSPHWHEWISRDARSFLSNRSHVFDRRGVLVTGGTCEKL